MASVWRAARAWARDAHTATRRHGRAHSKCNIHERAEGEAAALIQTAALSDGDEADNMAGASVAFLCCATPLVALLR